MRNLHPVVLSIFVLAVAVACGGGGGGGGGGLPAARSGSGSAPTGGGVRTFREGVILLGENDYEDLIESGARITFTEPLSSLRDAETGSILVATHDGGFARRVVSVVQRSTSRVVFEAEPVTLGEVFRQHEPEEVRSAGEESIQVAPGIALKDRREPVDGGAAATLKPAKTLRLSTLDLGIDCPLYENGEDAIRLRGEVTIDPSLLFSMRIDPDGLQSARLRTHLGLEGTLEAVGETAAPAEISARRSLLRHALPFRSGEVAGRVVLELIAGVEADLDGVARVDAGVSGSAELQGIFSQGAGWQGTQSSSLTFTGGQAAGIEGKLRPSLTVVVSLELFGVMDSVASFEAFSDLCGVRNTAGDQVYWTHTTGLRGSLKAGIGILDGAADVWAMDDLLYRSQQQSSGAYTVSLAPPAMPTGLTARPVPNGIRLTWEDNSIDESLFALEWRPAGSGSFRALTLLDADTTEYVDTGVTPSSGRIDYRVRALSGATSSAWSNTASAAAESADDYSDRREGAEHVTLSLAVSGKLEDFGDADMFLLTPASNGVYVAGTSGQTDTCLTIRDESGAVVARNDDRSEIDLNAEVGVSLSAGETYAIAVTGYRDRVGGSYSLLVHFAGTDPSDHAPNLSRELPTSSAISPVTYTAANVSRLFRALVTDPDGDAWAVRWFVDGVQYGASRGLESGETTSSRMLIHFGTAGTHRVSAVAVDRRGHESPELAWTVYVSRSMPGADEAELTLSITPRNIDANGLVILEARLGRQGFPRDALPDRVVRITVGDTVYEARTDSDGTVRFTHEAGAFASGKTQPVTAVFSGDSEYRSVEVTDSLYVRPKIRKKTRIILSRSAKDLVPGASVSLLARLVEDDATGTPLENRQVSFHADGVLVDKGTTDASGNAAGSWTPAAVGTYTLKASWSGNSLHDGTSSTTSVTIEKVRTAVAVQTSPKTIVPGTKVTISGYAWEDTASAPALAKRSVRIKIDDVVQGTATTDDQGAYQYSYTAAKAGSFAVTAEIFADTKYSGSSATATMKVTGKATSLSVEVSQKSAYVGDGVKVLVKLTETSSKAALSGLPVSVSIPGTGWSDGGKTGTDGSISFTWSAGATGSLEVEAKFAGDGTWESSDAAAALSVSRIPTRVTVTVSQTPVAPNATVNFTMKLVRTDTGAALANMPVKLLLNSLTFSSDKTSDKGELSGSYQPAKPGQWTVGGKFAGDASHAAAESSALFECVLKGAAFTISASPDPVRVGQKVSLTALMKMNTSPYSVITNKSVTFSVSGPSGGGSATTTSATDSSGKVYLGFTPAQHGDYTVKAAFAGDTEYAKVEQTLTLKVVRETVGISVSLSATSVEWSDTIDLTAKLTDSKGSAISSRTITMKISPTNFTRSYGTDGNGTYKFQFTPGSSDIRKQTATFTFAGDSWFEPKTATVDFTVTKVATKLITTCNPNPAKPGTKVQIQPRLVRKSDTSKGISGKSVTVSYSSAGYSKTTSTNSSGYGSVEYTTSSSYTGQLYFQTTFPGDSYYESSAEVPTLTVPANETKMTASVSKSTVAPLSTVTLKGKLQWKAFPYSPVSGREIKITVVGKSFSKSGKTDNNGEWSVSFQPQSGATGTYSVKVEFAGDGTFWQSDDSTTFKVEKMATTLKFLSLPSSAEVGDWVSIKVELSNADGYVLASAPLSMTINGGSVSGAMTNTSGQYGINSLAKLGTNSITVSFAGSGVYLSCSKSASFTGKDTTNPPVPTLQSPSDGSVITSGSNITFKWSAVSDASGIDHYVVEFYSRGLLWVYYLNSTYKPTTNSLSLGTAVISKGHWKWKVKAVDKAGRESSFSSEYKFEVK